ncbi:MAG: ABC transporter permease [Rhodobacteraceae bacterium]|nr:ABC transporter permease [Paracoccaceae bacterium]
MAERSGTALDIRQLNVFYGHSHALQGVNLALESGVVSVVGRNGMGKTTLCGAIMGLVPVTSGTINLFGASIVGEQPADIARRGIAYVPQGRRIWPSLTVDEHLRVVSGRRGPWSIDRIYSTFPRLAERRSSGGGQLSGGEQQMLAISRGLLQNPRLLVMDEPTEGLAPRIVRQVEEMLVRISSEASVNILLIEQNIGVACATSERVAIMVNGRIDRIVESARLASDRQLQHALLGVGRHKHEADEGEALETPSPVGTAQLNLVYLSNPSNPTRWSKPAPVSVVERSAQTQTTVDSPLRSAAAPASSARRRLSEVLVAGTMDTKGAELRFIRDVLRSSGIRARMVDLSTSGRPSGAEMPPHAIAGFHPRGAAAVFTGDRGSAVAAMTLAFERWMAQQQGIAGVIAAGGSGATAMVAPAMRSLPIGIPKLILSTVASGDVSRYVGPCDISMMYSVADIQGINSITRDVLFNAAAAFAGMVNARKTRPEAPPSNPAVGITMFGVTTSCVNKIMHALEDTHDCLVFHATGTGGRSMEKLLETQRLAAVIDVTTTEVCDMLVGGIFPADDQRFEASIRAGLPYTGSCGALDMVNFGPRDTVPERFLNRILYEHNPQVTLMRTTPEENEEMGRWIGGKLNRMQGPFRFYLPEGGVSELDRAGAPFWDPAARRALFAALEQSVTQGPDRKLVRTPCHINDDEFAALVASGFLEMQNPAGSAARGAR